VKTISDGTITGYADERFAGLIARFRDSFSTDAPLRELGGSLTVFLEGECVVDVWGGFEDAAQTRPFRRDALLCTFSAIKGMASLCVHIAAEQEQLDLDHPIAEAWPAFAAHGKDRITLRDVLTHQAGLQVATDNDFAIPHSADAWRQALEAAVPRNAVGAQHSYHTLTYGQILGEVLQRSTGQNARDFFRDQVAGPLMADVHIGVSKPMLARVCDSVAPSDADHVAMSSPPEVCARLVAVSAFLNDNLLRTGVFPYGGGYSTARGLAKVYAALANGGEFAGVRICSTDTVAAMQRLAWDDTEVQSNARWRMAQGVMLSTPPFNHFGEEPRAFGHAGLGGCVGFADPVRRLGFAYFPVRLFPSGGSGLRGPRLIAAAYESL